MMRIVKAGLLSMMMAALVMPAFAVQPDEVLDDPALEDRARDLSKGLRCLVCQNESIDESNAPLARELRLVVRERLVEGDTNDEVLDFLVERYGEFVLLMPRTDGWNMILWLSGPVLFLIALGVGTSYIRGRANAVTPTEAALSEAEKKRLEELLKD
ncbi:cytochrome c-type biogenesis protein CcmH [Marivita sp. S0852]|uniref:cytochrome c-type biogenesis protein n=1 Tax=Marivita sp. S0852 TaxID=3373893 RepID=UPI003982AEDE